jgi:hypothetical protein
MSEREPFRILWRTDDEGVSRDDELSVAGAAGSFVTFEWCEGEPGCYFCDGYDGNGCGLDDVDR